MSVKISTRRELTANPYSISAGDLRLLLQGVPDSAKISIDYYKGDVRDPDQVTLTVTAPTTNSEIN